MLIKRVDHSCYSRMIHFHSCRKTISSFPHPCLYIRYILRYSKVDKLLETIVEYSLQLETVILLIQLLNEEEKVIETAWYEGGRQWSIWLWFRKWSYGQRESLIFIITSMLETREVKVNGNHLHDIQPKNMMIKERWSSWKSISNSLHEGKLWEIICDLVILACRRQLSRDETPPSATNRFW